MKNAIILVLMVFFLFGCQKESFTVKESPEEESFLMDTELVTLMQSVASHDGRFDNAIDNADCFSIDFPYSILLNGEVYMVNSINDLLIIDYTDTIEPIFPLHITFANYEVATVTSLDTLIDLVTRCLKGELYNDRIVCVDFVYPILVAVYNPDTSNFETISFDHDKDTFVTITEFTSNALASINFPVKLITSDEEILTITSNDMLKAILEENDELLCP